MSADLKTPAALGYRVPADWETHAATWMAWPHGTGTWGQRTRAVQAVYARMASEIARGEDVQILVPDAAAEALARGVIEREGEPSPRIGFVHINTQTEWIRDFGPVFGTGGGSSIVLDFGFNSWGARDDSWKIDDDVPLHIAKHLGLQVFQSDLILEGGAVSVNGDGLVLATEACLLRGNRNPELGRTEKEALLTAFLGVDHILWLADGVAGAEDDGQVCDVARFANLHTVFAAFECDRTDDNNRPLRENHARLMRMYDKHGHRLQVVTIPMPHPMIDPDRGRLPATYLGYYVANECVLVPQFGCPQDDVALQSIRSVFHTRRVVGIDCCDLIRGGGACHGLLLEQPATPQKD